MYTNAAEGPRSEVGRPILICSPSLLSFSNLGDGISVLVLEQQDSETPAGDEPYEIIGEK